MTLILYALVQGPELGWTTLRVAVAAVIGIIALAAFVAIEARSAAPLMPLRLFRSRSVRLGVTITFLFMATFGTLLYFLSVYFQHVRGYGPLHTGVACLVPMGAVFLGSNLGGHIMTRLGLRTTLIVHLLIGALGMTLLALPLTSDQDYLALVPGLAVLSFGQGVVFPTMFAAVATGVPARDQGIASGIASSGQQVGSAVGLAVLVALSNAGTDGLTGEPLRAATADGVQTAILVAAAGAAITAVVARRLRITAASAEEPATAAA